MNLSNNQIVTKRVPRLSPKRIPKKTQNASKKANKNLPKLGPEKDPFSERNCPKAFEFIGFLLPNASTRVPRKVSKTHPKMLTKTFKKVIPKTSPNEPYNVIA